MNLPKVVTCFLFASVAACGPADSSNSSVSQPTPEAPSNQQPSPKLTQQVSLKAELEKGTTLVLTLTERALARSINDRMGTRNLALVQEGKEKIDVSEMKNWCEIASSGFVNSGDRFEIKSAEVEDKIYLAARQVTLRFSSYLAIRCRKGGMDQTEMTLKDLKQIFGSLIQMELIN